MVLADLDNAVLPATADLHVHLREGEMMKLVVPTIRAGGTNTVLVMPNLVPPVTSVERAVRYRAELAALEPAVDYLMTLYLHPDVTPATIAAAATAGITSVKSYPAGVTTNSSAGVVDYTAFYPVFAAMEEADMLLNIHGECPSSPAAATGGAGDGTDPVTILNAEPKFLPTLAEIHRQFPRLRIVLEHCTTAAAVAAVLACGDTVAATITAHHLSLIVDDWAGDPFSFCKPVAKLPSDRDALLRAAVSGSPKFFFGSDSAPHPATAKRGGEKIAAGVFTQPYVTQTVLDALAAGVERGVIRDEDVTVEKVADFMSNFGRRFYKIEGKDRGEKIRVSRQKGEIAKLLANPDESLAVVPFRRGESTWAVEWV